MSTIKLPPVEDYLSAINEMVEQALSAVDMVFPTIAKMAIEENQDVDGNPMPPKKPKPEKHPHNKPNTPLEQDRSPDMMSIKRWTVGEREGFSRSIVYNPPDYLEYLIDKDADHGGRKWITPDKINETAREEIQAEMLKRMLGE